jgi:hypothetical protein
MTGILKVWVEKMASAILAMSIFGLLHSLASFVITLVTVLARTMISILRSSFGEWISILIFFSEGKLCFLQTSGLIERFHHRLSTDHVL